MTSRYLMQADQDDPVDHALSLLYPESVRMPKLSRSNIDLSVTRVKLQHVAGAHR